MSKYNVDENGRILDPVVFTDIEELLKEKTIELEEFCKQHNIPYVFLELLPNKKDVSMVGWSLGKDAEVRTEHFARILSVMNKFIRENTGNQFGVLKVEE